MSALRSTFNFRAPRGLSGFFRVGRGQRAGRSLGASALLCAATLSLSGCNLILWGNIGVLAIAVGIFLGTVFLSRSSTVTRSASRSLSPTSSGAGTNSADNGRS